MRSQEHPCPNHNNVRVPRACDHKSIQAQTLGLGHVLKKTSSKTNLKAKHSSAKSLLQISLSCTHSAVPKIIRFRYLQKPCFSSKRVRNLRNKHISHSKPLRRHVRVSPSYFTTKLTVQQSSCKAFENTSYILSPELKAPKHTDT